MDGRLPKEIFWIKKYFYYKDFDKSYDDIVPPESELAEIDEEEIKSKLKNLGYIE